MADGGGSTADQWALAPAERELVMTKNRANWLSFAILLTFFRERGRFPRDGAEGYLLKVGQLEYDCRYSTMHGMPVTGGRGFRSLKPLWYKGVPP